MVQRLGALVRIVRQGAFLLEKREILFVCLLVQVCFCVSDKPEWYRATRLCTERSVQRLFLEDPDGSARTVKRRSITIEVVN